MSYFPCDIPFMSDEELKENGIQIPKDVTDKNVGNNDYIRKQEAIDLINKISNLDIKAKGGICVSIANLTKADVVQVVRCKDCARYLDLRHWCKCHNTTMFENDFCSYGRK